MSRAMCAVLVVAAVAAAGLAGCGGGDGTTGSITAAEFTKRANAICERSQRERTQRLNTANGWVEPGVPLTKAQREKVVRFVVVGTVEATSRQLRELAAEAGDPDRPTAYLQALAADLAGVKAKPLTMTSGSAFSKSDQIAGAAGLTSCTV